MSGPTLARALSLLGWLMLVGCSTLSAAPTTTPVPAAVVLSPRPAGQSSIEAADLALARQFWQADPARGRYRLELAVTGLAAGDGISVLEVVDGQVRRASRPDGQPVPASIMALTVERLLSLVEESLAEVATGRLAQLDVTFDGHSGVPIEIRIVEPGRAQPRHYLVRSYSALIG